MTMKVSIILEMILTDKNGADLMENRRAEIHHILFAAIQNRLFGEGFLPDDVFVETWKVTE